MSKMLRLAALSAVLAAALQASSLAAQRMAEQPRIHAVELTFHGGYFQPTGTGGAIGSVSLTRRPAWVGGARFNAYAPGGLWGVEVAGSYSPERVLQSSGTGNLGSRRDLTSCFLTNRFRTSTSIFRFIFSLLSFTVSSEPPEYVSRESCEVSKGLSGSREAW